MLTRSHVNLQGVTSGGGFGVCGNRERFGQRTKEETALTRGTRSTWGSPRTNPPFMLELETASELAQRIPKPLTMAETGRDRGRRVNRFALRPPALGKRRHSSKPYRKGDQYRAVLRVSIVAYQRAVHNLRGGGGSINTGWPGAWPGVVPRHAEAKQLLNPAYIWTRSVRPSSRSRRRREGIEG